MALDSHAAHRLVQWVLRGGLALATLLLAVGLVLALASGDHTAVPVRLHDVLSEGATADRLIAIGLVLLAFTPVVRVLSLVVIWAIERDRKFVLVGLAVVAVLAAAIATGHG
ncbi:MAG: DUF1634 domain-containing protein [Acidobacteriota bacterium]